MNPLKSPRSFHRKRNSKIVALDLLHFFFNREKLSKPRDTIKCERNRDDIIFGEALWNLKTVDEKTSRMELHEMLLSKCAASWFMCKLEELIN